MKMSEAVEGFIICRTGNRIGDLSPKTIRLYNHVLTRLCEALGNPDISTVTQFDLERFMASLATPERGLSSSAQHNYYKAIRSLWNWAAETLHIEPVHKNLRSPIVIFEPVTPYTKSDIQRILHACEYTTRTCRKSREPYSQSRQSETRDKGIIYLLLDTGLRIGEICRLTLADINLEYNTLRVVPYHSGKKSRPREIPFGRNAKKLLWKYISESKPTEKRPFFGLTTTGMTRLFTRLSQRSSVQNVHAHRFRHTFAIQFLRNNGNLFSLQHILGHSDLTMCRRYLAIAEKDVQLDHMSASPADNWL